MSFLESLNWRYATKRMNGKKVPQEKVDIILEAARLAPTHSGLQPFHIISISDPALLEKIRPIANNQPQITEASHLLVFAAWDDITNEKIDEVFDLVIKERDLPANGLDNYRNYLKSHFAGKPREERFQAAARQTYVAFGIAIAAAATEQVDATPMEGFRNAELDELLGLKEKGLRSVTLLPLGYRDEDNDWLLRQKKVRRPKDEFVIYA
ncbi:MAG: nitroreductase family protein [Chitinophagaceae bacterium]|nr:nitroreductase family protein [Chitinophagaceae bacterium]